MRLHFYIIDACLLPIFIVQGLLSTHSSTRTLTGGAIYMPTQITTNPECFTYHAYHTGIQGLSNGGVVIAWLQPLKTAQVMYGNIFDITLTPLSNTSTQLADAGFPYFAPLPNGSFVLAFQSNSNEFQLYSSNGTLIQGQISFGTSNNKYYPLGVTSLTNGEPVVAFANSTGVWAKQYNSEGTNLVHTYLLSPNTETYNFTNFLIGGLARLTNGSLYGVFFAEYSSNPVPNTSQLFGVQYNTTDFSIIEGPTLLSSQLPNSEANLTSGIYCINVLSLQDGGVLIVWVLPKSPYGIFAQIEGPSPISTFLVSNSSIYANYSLSDTGACQLSNGLIAITWVGGSVWSTNNKVHYVLLNITGGNLEYIMGPSLVCNDFEFQYEDQGDASIGSLTPGGFIVAWIEKQPNYTGELVYALRFSNNGSNVPWSYCESNNECGGNNTECISGICSTLPMTFQIYLYAGIGFIILIAVGSMVFLGVRCCRRAFTKRVHEQVEERVISLIAISSANDKENTFDEIQQSSKILNDETLAANYANLRAALHN